MNDIKYFESVKEVLKFMKLLNLKIHREHLKDGGLHYLPTPSPRFIHETAKRLAKAKLKERTDG